jgi:hypothetical protein
MHVTLINTHTLSTDNNLKRHFIQCNNNYNQVFSTMTQGWYILSPLDKNTLLKYKKNYEMYTLFNNSGAFIRILHCKWHSDIIHVWIVVYFTGNYRNYTIKGSEGSLETPTWSLPQVERYLHVKCPLLSSNFNQERNMLTNCSITPKSQFFLF